MTVAALGFSVDTSPLARAVADLDRLTASTKKAETAAKQVSNGTTAAASAAEKLSSAAKKAGDAVRGAIGGSTLTAAAQYAQSVDRAAKSLSGFEAIAARAAAEAQHVVGEMQRMSSADIRNRDIQAYGSELDRLRSKFSPLFREISRYRTTLGEIRQAHAVGAISTDEMTAAISRERQASLSAIGAIKGRTHAIREADSAVKRFHTTNLLFQAQDVAMMAAMGQAPHILALQQGSQVAGIFHQIGNGRQIVEALKGAFIGLLNPISLATVGVIGLGTAAYQYLTSGSESVNRLDTVLENHKALIDEVKAAYGDAAIAASDYAKKSGDELNLRLKADVEEMKLQLRASLNELITGGSIGQMSVGLNAEGVNAGFLRANKEFEIFRGQIARLHREGEPALAAIRKEIIAIGLEQGAEIQAVKLLGILKPVNDLDEGIRQSTEGIDQFSVVMGEMAALIDTIHSEKAQQELKKLADEAVNGGKSTNELKQALAGISGYAPDLSAAISEFMRLIGVIRDAKAEAEHMVYPNGVRIGSPSQGGRTRYGSTGFMQLPENVGVTPTTRVDPYFEDWRKKTPKSQAERDAERAKKAYADMVRDSHQYVAAQELEQQALYMTAEAADTLRFQQELLNQAANDNIDLNAMAADGIRTKRQELIDLAKDMAGAKAAYDAANEALKFGKDLVRGFVSDLRSGLEQGKGFWRSFGDAALNALDKIVDKLLNEVIDAIFQVNKAGSSGGGGGLFGFLGGLFGGGGGFTGFERAWTAAVPGLWAKGGTFPNGIHGFSNTVVDRATPFMFAKGAGIMGEAGPEAIMPLKRGPDGRLGVSAANGGAANQNHANQNVHVTVGVSVDRNGNLQAYVKNVSQREGQAAATAVVQQYDREALPARVNQIANDPYARG